MNDKREERILSIGMEYARIILGKWAELIVIREEFRENFISKRKDMNLMRLYITKLTSLYIELYPKIIERSDFGEEFIERYKGFNKYYHNPTLFYEDGEAVKLFELEECLSIALDKLKVLDFEA
jgi:hypothetical protein